MPHVMIFLDRMNATVSMVSPAMAPIAMVFGAFYFYLHFCADGFSKAEFFICIREPSSLNDCTNNSFFPNRCGNYDIFLS